MGVQKKREIANCMHLEAIKEIVLKSAYNISRTIFFLKKQMSFLAKDISLIGIYESSNYEIFWQ